MQKRVGFTSFHGVHFFQRSICVGKIFVVFRMLCYPLACYGFYSFQRLRGTRLGVNSAKKSANIGL